MEIIKGPRCFSRAFDTLPVLSGIQTATSSLPDTSYFGLQPGGVSSVILSSGLFFVILLTHHLQLFLLLLFRDAVFR